MNSPSARTNTHPGSATTNTDHITHPHDDNTNNDADDPDNTPAATPNAPDTTAAADGLLYSTDSEWESGPWSRVSYKKTRSRKHQSSPTDNTDKLYNHRSISPGQENGHHDPSVHLPTNIDTMDCTDTEFFNGHGDPVHTKNVAIDSATVTDEHDHPEAMDITDRPDSDLATEENADNSHPESMTIRTTTTTHH